MLVNAKGGPGMDAAIVSSERVVIAEGLPPTWKTALISSAAVDAGNTPTTILRAGLIMAQLDSGSKWVAYDPTLTTGAELALGVLTESVQMFDPTGVAVDKEWRVMVGGPLRASQLLNVDAQARAAMASNFTFDDDLLNAGEFLGHPIRIVQKAADYTVVAADNGKLFLATAAVNFTLPVKAVGLSFEFMQTADANMAILSASSSDDIIVDGDAGADSVTYSTSSHKIGSRCRVLCAYVGANLRWLHSNLGGTTQTIA